MKKIKLIFKKYKNTIGKFGEAFFIAGMIDILKMPNATFGSLFILVIGGIIIFLSERSK